MKKFRSKVKQALAAERKQQGAPIRRSDLAAAERRRFAVLEAEGQAAAAERGHLLPPVKFHAHRPNPMWIAFCQRDRCYHALMVCPSRVPGYDGSAVTRQCMGDIETRGETNMTAEKKAKLEALKAAAKSNKGKREGSRRTKQAGLREPMLAALTKRALCYNCLAAELKVDARGGLGPIRGLRAEKAVLQKKTVCAGCKRVRACHAAPGVDMPAPPKDAGRFEPVEKVKGTPKKASAKKAPAKKKAVAKKATAKKAVEKQQHAA